MLKILRSIVQEVSTTPNFGEALQVLVARIRTAMNTQACSAFLIDKSQQEYVLLATAGLNPDAVGRVRVQLAQGLIGLIGQREEPINIEDAPTHPHFLRVAEVAEERFRAFLGVPIIQHRQLLGVLIIQQEECRRFDETDEAFLVTMAAQLGGIIAHAEAIGQLSLLLSCSSPKTQHDILLRGTPSAPGISLGTVVVSYPLADLEAVPDRPIKHPATEIKAFKSALAAARSEINALKDRVQKTLGPEENLLFTAYLSILDSTALSQEITTEINQGQWAQGALRKVIQRHVRQFEIMDDDYLRERATDIRDLGRRILCQLQQQQRATLHYPAQTILAGEEVTVSALAEVPEGRLAGVIASRGSNNSHVAILARALGVPAVLGISSLPVAQLEGITVIANGYEGQVYLHPSKQLKKNCEKLISRQTQLTSSFAELRDLPAQTLDGRRIALWVNTGLDVDAELSLTAGAEGIGLYRTEIPFMHRDHFPTEAEQYVIYRKLLHAFAPRPVIMRTLDIGGDKALPYFPIKEANPFLGWRGIRVTLDHPELFLMQLRAMLRASCSVDNLRIMLPMITTVNETDEALRLIRQAYEEIFNENPQVKWPLIGVMLEVPAAILQTAALASRVDFLSVGSNDLTQYLLAVDRNNARVANLYDGLNPAVLQALNHAVKIARRFHKPISICGELASDPLAAVILLGMGFNALSMNAAAIPRIKWVIRKFTGQQAQQLLRAVLKLEETQQIRQYLTEALIAHGLGNLFSEGSIK